MKIAVVYNSPDAAVLKRLGPRAEEIYPRGNVERIVDALRGCGVSRPVHGLTPEARMQPSVLDADVELAEEH